MLKQLTKWAMRVLPEKSEEEQAELELVMEVCARLLDLNGALEHRNCRPFSWDVPGSLTDSFVNPKYGYFARDGSVGLTVSWRPLDMYSSTLIEVYSGDTSFYVDCKKARRHAFKAYRKLDNSRRARKYRRVTRSLQSSEQTD